MSNRTFENEQIELAHRAARAFSEGHGHPTSVAQTSVDALLEALDAENSLAETFMLAQLRNAVREAADRFRLKTKRQ